MIKLLIVFAASLLIGFLIGLLYKHYCRKRDVDFIRITSNIVVAVFVLLFSFGLFGIIGLNIWTVTIIPVTCLIVIFFVVRNGMAKLLEVK